MRVMGLDLGSRTIGVAVSDPLGYTAQGVEVIRRRSLDDDLARLGEIMDYYNIRSIVVGMPKNMDGTYGLAAKEVRSFCDILFEKFSIPIFEEDERLTTVAAEKILLEANLSRRRRKKVIDKIAAVLILESFLARQDKRD